MAEGVSVVICCYNSAERLPRTLTHLAAQRVSEKLPWEVIVIDNASQDKTDEVALKIWDGIGTAPIRVVEEPRSGQAFARNRGMAEAEYDFVSFVDDDNWVSPDWVELVWQIMKSNPQVGACGGFSEAVCEVEPPTWFEHYKTSYAIGPENIKPGDVTNSPGWLWGAGLTIRKSAWQQLVFKGFSPLLQGRQRAKLSSGDDSELCFALRLAGWRLWYDPRLRFQHFLTAPRFKWAYLRRLHRAFGAASVAHDPYLFVLENLQAQSNAMPVWGNEIMAVLKSIYWKKRSIPSWLFSRRKVETLQIDGDLGRLLELLQRRTRYDLTIREIQKAGWRCAR